MIKKTVLFIAPLFYGYEKEILKALQKRYSKVIFYKEIPFNPELFFAFRRFSEILANKLLDFYLNHLCDKVKKKQVDKIFIIRGYGIKDIFLKHICERYPNIEIINYQWDSIANNPNGLTISKYAHKNYTFDPLDVSKYPQFKYLPLFYNWDIFSNQKKVIWNNERKIDVLFVGGYNSERNKIVKYISQICKEKDLKFLCVIYHPFGSFIRKLFSLDKVDIRDITFRKISRKKYFELLRLSRVVLDIQHPCQSGATIRTIEALSLGCKLLSTNKMLKYEKFYSENNIQIIDKDINIDDLICKKIDYSKKKYLLDIDKWLDEIEM